MYGIRQLLSQFADDIAAFLSYERIVLENFVNILQHVEEEMGLKISYEKTTVYRVGSLHKTNAKLYTQQNLEWSDGPIELLGVSIPCDGAESKDFKEILVKVRAVCSKWINRRATLNGKILIVNTLIGSLFTYKLTTMLNMTSAQIKEVETIIREFLWNGKKPKINYKMLQKSKINGGLKLVDLQAKQDSIKISWIFKLEENTFLSACAYETLGKKLNSLVWRCNIKVKDAKIEFLDNVNNFWVQVLLAWCKINYKKPVGKEAVLGQILWMNSNIKVNGRLVIWGSWINKNIITIEDLMKMEYGKWIYKSATELNVNWLDYESLKKAIPEEWTLSIENNTWGPESCELYHELFKTKNISRKVYDKLIEDRYMMLKYATRLNEQGLEIDLENYFETFKRINKYTKVTKFRDFQYRLSLGKIVLNKDLKEWGIKESDLCSMCGLETENIRHFFFECEKIQELLTWFYDLSNTAGLNFPIDCTSFILNVGTDKPKHIIHFVNTFMKQFLYRQRCTGQQINVFSLQKALEAHHRVEYAIAKSECRIQQHIKRWSPIVEFVDCENDAPA